MHWIFGSIVTCWYAGTSILVVAILFRRDFFRLDITEQAIHSFAVVFVASLHSVLILAGVMWMFGLGFSPAEFAEISAVIAVCVMVLSYLCRRAWQSWHSWRIRASFVFPPYIPVVLLDETI